MEVGGVGDGRDWKRWEELEMVGIGRGGRS